MSTGAADPSQTHLSLELEPKAPQIACRFDPTGRYAFAAAEDRTIGRWELATKQFASFAGHDGWVLALGFSPDGATLLSGGSDGNLFWWPAAGTETPATIRRVETGHGWVRSIAVSPDGQTVVTCGNDRMVRLWSMADGTPLTALPGHERPVYRAVFTPDGKTLLSADLKGVVIQWDVRPGKEARRFDASKLYSYNGGQQVDYGGVRDLSLSRDGRFLACCGLIEGSNPLGAVNNPAVVLLDWQEGKELLLQRPKEDIKGVAWGVRFHPDGFLVAASGGTGGGFLLFWKPDAVNEFHKLGLPNTARGLDLHPDGVRVAVAHHDGKLRIYAMQAKAG
jgi:WD40 repeat protein